MSKTDSTLEDIKSGKGLQPITSDTSTSTNGLTSESRDNNTSGLRTDKFELNSKETSERN